MSQRDRRTEFRLPDHPFASFDRPDFVLAAIPLVFLLSLSLGQALSWSPRLSLVGASVCGALLIGDSLFRNPPR